MEKLRQYAYLMRWDKPVGMLLLLWPTLWALWIASHGRPSWRVFCIFTLGVMIMRSAGCVVNDIADREIDKKVRRTKDRPLASGKVSLPEAYALAALLLGLAFLLVLTCNHLTIALAFIGAGLATLYPLLKRFTHLPQVGLGVAFSWGVPMAFAQVTGGLTLFAWFLFLTAAIWPLIYDTMYAMVDRQDDVRIGVKSTAILFNHMDKLIIGLLQCLFLIMLVIVGLMFSLKIPYYLSLIVVVGLFAYQQWLIRLRHEQHCLQSFYNNNLVGLVILMGIVMSY